MQTTYREETYTEPPRGARDSRSLTELVRHLANETTALIRGEVALAKAETSEKISQVQSGIASVAAGGAIILAGFVMFLWAATLFINQWIREPWLSGLIVAAGTILIGLILVFKGRSDMKPKNLVPDRTAESLKRDKNAVEREARRAQQVKKERTTTNERREPAHVGGPETRPETRGVER